MSGKSSKDEAGRRKIKVQDRRVTAEQAEQASSSAPAGEEAAAAQDDQAERDPLRAELEEAQRLAEDRLDQLRRLKADYENSRQRMIREQTEVVDRASSRVIERLLPVLDDFDLALAAALERSPDDTFVKGVQLVFRKLQEVLEAEGLERLDASGTPFDPHDHEAIASEPGEVSVATVLEVVRPGYKVKGKMIRAALVRVATPSGGQAATGDGDGQEPEGG